MQVVYNKLWLAELHNIVDSLKIALQPTKMEKINTLHFEWHCPKSKVLYFSPNFNDIWFQSPDDKMFALVLSIGLFF